MQKGRLVLVPFVRLACLQKKRRRKGGEGGGKGGEEEEEEELGFKYVIVVAYFETLLCM